MEQTKQTNLNANANAPRSAHILNRAQYQNHHPEYQEMITESKNEISEALSSKGITITDWITTNLDNKSLWVLELDTRNQTKPLLHEDFDPYWTCNISYIEYKPYNMVVTIICEC